MLTGLLFLAACVQSAASPPEPEALYADMAQRMSDVRSLHISSRATKFPVTTVSEIDLVIPNKFRFKVEYERDEEGTLPIVRGISVDGFSFVKYAGIKGWIPEANAAFTDLNNLLPVVTKEVSDLTFISREKVGSDRAVHMRGNLDEEAVQKFEPETIPMVARVDLWIKESDPVLMRIRLDLSASEDSFPGWQATIDMTISRIKTVQIDRPPQEEIFSEASKNEDIEFDLPEEDLRALFRLAWRMRDWDPGPSGWPFRGSPMSPVHLALMGAAAQNYREKTGIDLLEEWN